MDQVLPLEDVPNRMKKKELDNSINEEDIDNIENVAIVHYTPPYASPLNNKL